MAARPEYEENGVHCSAIINPLAVRTQRVLSFMLRDEWSHFLPESITDLPLVARHASPSEIIILYYLTIPFGIGSKSNNPNIAERLKRLAAKIMAEKPLTQATFDRYTQLMTRTPGVTVDANAQLPQNIYGAAAMQAVSMQPHIWDISFTGRAVVAR